MVVRPLPITFSGLAMLPKTDAQKRYAVEVTMSSQIEKLNGNIAKPLVTGCCGKAKGNPNDDIKKIRK